MSHCDPTTLALAALGEDIPAEDAAHVQTCDQCRAEVADLAAVVSIGREAPAELPEVPDHVWASIQQELGLSQGPGGAGSGGSAAGGATIYQLPLRPAQFEPPAAAPAGPPPVGGTVVPMQPKNGRGRLFSVAAVAAVVGAFVGGAVVWSSVGRVTGGGEGVAQQLVAHAVLDPLNESVSSPGEATVLESPDGQVVRVDARSLPKKDGFYEVWLLDADATKLVALGALPSGSVGTFTVPPGISIDDFPVVDISLESYDGDPGHSSDSLMRGRLEA